ncbi:MAG: hypothetical protein WBX38_16990 [Candidatus Sulfotelmatobacter sp.]
MLHHADENFDFIAAAFHVSSGALCDLYSAGTGTVKQISRP